MANSKKDWTEISTESMVVAVKDQVSANLEEESVILNLQDGIYYGLNPVGARIWQLVQEPRRVSEILDTVLEEYEVDPQQGQEDLLNLLQELAAKKLIEVKVG